MPINIPLQSFPWDAQSNGFIAALTASGLAFIVDYPEDDDVSFHTMPNIPVGWRWDDGFIVMVMDICGLAYNRYRAVTLADVYAEVKKAAINGYTALCARYADGVMNCWSVVCEVNDCGRRI